MNQHVRTSFETFTATLALLLAPVAGARAQTCPDAAALARGLEGPAADIRFLADDALRGREVGTPGERCAADYLAARFEEVGLEPAGDQGSWFQTFDIRRGAELGPDNRLVVDGRTYALGSEWTPLGYSASASLERELVYGGHLLSSPGNTDDDEFAHIDLSGKIVVVEWGDPDAPHGVSVRGDPHFKATVAAGRGADGILVLAPVGLELPGLDDETRAILDIPAAMVSGEVAEGVREALIGGARAELATDVRVTTAEARNVVA
ncbi:MAG TPA: PA domain-containing protein, partial [Longimicrobiales bacterium]|nr:PA domain-containing protein [Longimicrobiales bacterium]